jgi:hypothetical protein
LVGTNGEFPGAYRLHSVLWHAGTAVSFSDTVAFILLHGTQELTMFIWYGGLYSLVQCAGTAIFVWYDGLLSGTWYTETTMFIWYGGLYFVQCPGTAIFVWNDGLLSGTWYTETTMFIWYGGLQSVCKK